MQEVRAILCRPIFLLIMLGYAANTGMMMGVSTFGSALLMEFGCVGPLLGHHWLPIPPA